MSAQFVMIHFFRQITSWMNLGFPVSISRIMISLFAWFLHDCGALSISALSQHWNSVTVCILRVSLLSLSLSVCLFKAFYKILNNFFHFVHHWTVYLVPTPSCPSVFKHLPPWMLQFCFCKTLNNFGKHATFSFIIVIAIARQYILAEMHIVCILSSTW